MTYGGDTIPVNLLDKEKEEAQMKYLIVVIILSMSISACSQKSDNTFVNKIVNDFSRNSYFLIVNVSLPKGKVKSIIEITICFIFLVN